MTLTIPQESVFILETLRKAGYEGYIVGGAVRDSLLQKKNAYDFDFTTNATPKQILALFPESFYENDFGTVSIAPKHIWEMMGIETPTSEFLQEKEKKKIIDVARATKLHISLDFPDVSSSSVSEHMPNFEITTFRSDGVYRDHRRPETVTWGKTLEEDLSRRDFTVNAMAIHIKNMETIVIDPFHGQEDLKNAIIRTVGDPAERFEEDALRMLRAIRFSVQLNMQMSDEVFTAIAALADHIHHVSWERIRDELLKMLASEYPAEALELLHDTGLLKWIIPELLEGKGVEQGGHHITDVWVHSIDALRNTPSTDPIVRLATLLHDVAKPRTFRSGTSKPSFHNHEIIGARLAKEIAQRLRLSKKDIERIYILVRFHMFYYQPSHTDAAIRRFMRNVGLENIDDILDVREGDRLGSGARKTSWRLEEMKERMIEQLHQPFSITDLEIDGTILMNELGLHPGPELGKILNALFEVVLEKPEMNTRKILLEEAKKYI